MPERRADCLAHADYRKLVAIDETFFPQRVLSRNQSHHL